MKKIISLFLCLTVIAASGITIFAYENDNKTKINTTDLLDVLEEAQRNEKAVYDEDWIEYFNNNSSFNISSDTMVSVDIGTGDGVNTTTDSESAADEEKIEETVQQGLKSEEISSKEIRTASETDEEILLNPVNAPFNVIN